MTNEEIIAMVREKLAEKNATIVQLQARIRELENEGAELRGRLSAADGVIATVENLLHPAETDKA